MSDVTGGQTASRCVVFRGSPVPELGKKGTSSFGEVALVGRTLSGAYR